MVNRMAEMMLFTVAAMATRGVAAAGGVLAPSKAVNIITILTDDQGFGDSG